MADSNDAKSGVAEVYKQVGENYRMYKRWRQACLAGSFAIIGVVVYAARDYAGSHVGVLAIAAAVAQWILAQVDARTERLFRMAIESGASLEAHLLSKPYPSTDGLSCTGPFTMLQDDQLGRLMTPRPKWVVLRTHSAALAVMMYGAAALLVTAGIVFISTPDQK